MGEVIAFPGDEREPSKVRGQTFDQRLDALRGETVPYDRREAVARALGQLASKVSPTPKHGAKEIIKAAGRSDLASHRKRIILLDGEQPDKMGFRSAWADYIGLGEAAAKLLKFADADKDKERERLLRRIVDARQVGSAPELTEDAFDISSLVTGYIAKIVERVRSKVPELEDLRRLSMSQSCLENIRDCIVKLPLGALEWEVSIDAFFFPVDLIEKCPQTIISGNLFWEDPDSNEEAAHFARWLSQFNSPIGLPEQPFDPNLGFGWKRIRIKIYESVLLSVGPPMAFSSVENGEVSYCNHWEGVLSLDGCRMYTTPVIQYGRQPLNDKYINEIVQGNQIYDYREDDLCLPCYNFWDTKFAVLHCADPDSRSKLDTSQSKQHTPFLLDAHDDAFRQLDETEFTSFIQKDQLEGRTLKALRTGKHDDTPRFIPNFKVDDDHIVPASDGSFAACLLRNMRHAPEGERLDDIAIVEALSVAEKTKIELEKMASLVATYREGLDKNRILVSDL